MNTECKIPSITGLTTISALNAVDLNVSDLVKKADYDAKISDNETKYFTTSDYNKFASEIVSVTIKEKGLVGKSDIFEFIGNSDLDKKLATLAAKAELKGEQDKIEKPKTFYSSCFRGKSHLKLMPRKIICSFSQSMNILKRLLIAIMFQRGILKDFLMKVLKFLLHLIIVLLKSYSLALSNINTKLQVKFDGRCLKQDKVTITLEQMVNICIFSEINLWSYVQGVDFALGNA